MKLELEHAPEAASEEVEQLREQLREKDRTIEELKQQLRDASKAEKEALTDHLTGLYNRRGLMRSLELVMPQPEEGGEGPARRAAAGGKGKNLAVLFADIDHFKEINDTHGHREGDRIIKEAADYLAHTMRRGDIVAREGGDEFIVVFNGATDRIINKFFDHDAEPQRPRLGFSTTIGEGAEKRAINVTFSGGITLVEPGETTENFASDIKQRADTALYESKKAGRDRLTLFKAPSQKR